MSSSSTPKSNTNSNSNSNNNKATTKTPLLYRVLTWLQALVQGLVLLCLAAFLVNWLYATFRIATIRRDLSTDASLRFVSVPSAAVPLHVKCELAGGVRRASLFVIPGAGGNWLFNAMPIWPLPKLMPGVEVCSLARQGHVFTDGWHDNATAVNAITNQVVELIGAVTDPALPLWIAGHSYGGPQAALVTKRLLDNGRAPPHAVFIFDPAPAFLAAADRARAAEMVAKMAKQLRFVEVASSLGILNLFQSQLLAAPQFSNALESVPQRYHDAFVYTATAQQTYKGLCADLERVNVTVEALSDAIASAKGPLLGDVPVEIVYASRPRFDPPNEEYEELAAEAESKSLYDTLSTATQRSTIEGADHMFLNSSEVVLKTLKVIVSTIAPTLKALATKTAAQ